MVALIVAQVVPRDGEKIKSDLNSGQQAFKRYVMKYINKRYFLQENNKFFKEKCLKEYVFRLFHSIVLHFMHKSLMLQSDMRMLRFL